jgi:uncharacterized OB-fold protein
MIDAMPLPTTDDPTDAPFWQATARRELVVQECAACGAPRHPPRPMCPHCQSMETRWEPVSGYGRVWSFAVPRPPLLPAFAAMAPYVTAVVELRELPQIRMVGAMLDESTGRFLSADGAGAAIGAAVRVSFMRCTEDVTLPCWVLIADSTRVLQEESSHGN